MSNRAMRSEEWYRAEAKIEARERAEAHRERTAPMHIRPTARKAVDNRIEVSGGFGARTGDYPIAWLAAHRFRHGISVEGAGSVEQLVELRDAINARIAEVEDG